MTRVKTLNTIGYTLIMKDNSGNVVYTSIPGVFWYLIQNRTITLFGKDNKMLASLEYNGYILELDI